MKIGRPKILQLAIFGIQILNPGYEYVSRYRTEPDKGGSRPVMQDAGQKVSGIGTTKGAKGPKMTSGQCGP